MWRTGAEVPHDVEMLWRKHSLLAGIGWYATSVPRAVKGGVQRWLPIAHAFLLSVVTSGVPGTSIRFLPIVLPLYAEIWRTHL